MNPEMPDSIEIQTAPHPQASIIWLHGLGADGYDFTPMAETLHLPVAVRYIFPHAPIRPVTINGGYAMRAWYDVCSPVITHLQDESGIRASQRLLENLITRETRRGIDPRRIFLAGFSQGGAIALHTGLRYPERLGGVIALSTYLPLQDSVAEERNPSNAGIPILMAHGTQDTVILRSEALHSSALLCNLGYAIEWHDYDMPHTVCPEEIGDIQAFILAALTDSAFRS